MSFESKSMISLTKKLVKDAERVDLARYLDDREAMLRAVEDVQEVVKAIKNFSAKEGVK